MVDGVEELVTVVARYHEIRYQELLAKLDQLQKYLIKQKAEGKTYHLCLDAMFSTKLIRSRVHHLPHPLDRESFHEQALYWSRRCAP